MGYGCNRIVLEKGIGHISPEMLLFWEKFYGEICLEYIYLNKSVSKMAIENRTSSEHGISSTVFVDLARSAIQFFNHKHQNIPLVPIGGAYMLHATLSRTKHHVTYVLFQGVRIVWWSGI